MTGQIEEDVGLFGERNTELQVAEFIINFL